MIAITTLAIKHTTIAIWVQIQWRGMSPKLANTIGPQRPHSII